MVNKNGQDFLDMYRKIKLAVEIFRIIWSFWYIENIYHKTFQRAGLELIIKNQSKISNTVGFNDMIDWNWSAPCILSH